MEVLTSSVPTPGVRYTPQAIGLWAGVLCMLDLRRLPPESAASAAIGKGNTLSESVRGVRQQPRTNQSSGWCVIVWDGTDRRSFRRGRSWGFSCVTVRASTGQRSENDVDAVLDVATAQTGAVVPLLNGIDHVALLRKRFGQDRVVPPIIAVETLRIGYLNTFKRSAQIGRFYRDPQHVDRAGRASK
jgi:hypothetical protein